MKRTRAMREPQPPRRDLPRIAVLEYLGEKRARIRYACGCSGRLGFTIKVPPEIHPYCRSLGWLTNTKRFTDVVAFHHPDAARRSSEVSKQILRNGFGLESRFCEACVLAKLQDAFRAVCPDPLPSAGAAKTGTEP